MWIRRIMGMLIVSTCLGLVGCGQSASDKLIGRWQYNPIGKVESSDKQTGGVGTAKGLVAGAVETLGRMTALELEFTSDRTLSAGWLRVTVPGTIYWSVGEVDGDQVTLKVGGQDGKNTIDMKITFVDDDHFRFAPPGAGGKTLLFERVASE
ncbi:MAG: hypothetical protein V3R99_04850 [Thermoguttaceae bacterium]